MNSTLAHSTLFSDKNLMGRYLGSAGTFYASTAAALCLLVSLEVQGQSRLHWSTLALIWLAAPTIAAIASAYLVQAGVRLFSPDDTLDSPPVSFICREAILALLAIALVVSAGQRNERSEKQQDSAYACAAPVPVVAWSDTVISSLPVSN